MSIIVIVLGVIAILCSLVVGIINLYYGGRESDKTKRNTEYAAAVLSGITVVLLFIMIIVGYFSGGSGLGSMAAVAAL